MTALQTLLVGQQIFLRVYLTDPSTGDPNDPTTQDPVDDATITLTVYPPDNVTVDVPLTHVSTGTYTGSFTATQDGKHEYVSSAGGFAAGKGRNRFHVSAIP